MLQKMAASSPLVSNSPTIRFELLNNIVEGSSGTALSMTWLHIPEDLKLG
jgi:hypothetical protein